MQEGPHENGIAEFLKFHWRGLFHLFTFLTLLPFSFMDPLKVKCVIFLHQLMFLWYIADVIPPGITAILPIIVLPAYGVMSSDDVCNTYGMGQSMTFLLSYFVAVALEQTQTSHLMAYNWISVFSHNPRVLLLTIMLTSWTMSIIVPDPIVCSLMLPLTKSIIQVLESISIGQLYENRIGRPRPTSLTKAFGIGVAYSTTIGGMVTLYSSKVGETLCTEVQKLLPNATGQITFITYLIIGLPFSLILLLCTMLFLEVIYLGFLREYSSNNLKYNKEMCKKALREIISELPPYKMGNIITLMCWILLAILCIFLNPLIIKNFYDGWNEMKINYSTACTFICLLLCILPVSYDFVNYFRCRQPVIVQTSPSILSWQLMRMHMPWNYLLVYGSSMVLQRSLKRTYYFTRISSRVSSVPMPLQKTFYIFESIFLSAMGENHFVTKFFINTAVHQCLLKNQHPGNVLYSIALGSSISFFLPISSINNCFVCNWFFIRTKTLILASIGPTFCAMFLAMGMVSTIVPRIHPEFDSPPYPNIQISHKSF